MKRVIRYYIGKPVLLNVEGEKPTLEYVTQLRRDGGAIFGGTDGVFMEVDKYGDVDGGGWGGKDAYIDDCVVSI